MEASLYHVSTCLRASDDRAEGIFMIIRSNPPYFTLGKIGGSKSFLKVKSRAGPRTLSLVASEMSHLIVLFSYGPSQLL